MEEQIGHHTNFSHFQIPLHIIAPSGRAGSNYSMVNVSRRRHERSFS